MAATQARPDRPMAAEEEACAMESLSWGSTRLARCSPLGTGASAKGSLPPESNQAPRSRT
eukprot:9207727-Lingulodinium_polyedra.AAC.1